MHYILYSLWEIVSIFLADQMERRGDNIQGKDNKLGLQWKLASTALLTSWASYGSQRFSCSLPFSYYHLLWESFLCSDTFHRVGISSEICQFSCGRDLFGLRESGGRSISFCIHSLHEKIFLFPCFPIKKSRLQNHWAKVWFKIPKLNWRLQMGALSVFTAGNPTHSPLLCYQLGDEKDTQDVAFFLLLHCCWHPRRPVCLSQSFLLGARQQLKVEVGSECEDIRASHPRTARGAQEFPMAHPLVPPGARQPNRDRHQLGPRED